METTKQSHKTALQELHRHRKAAERIEAFLISEGASLPLFSLEPRTPEEKILLLKQELQAAKDEAAKWQRKYCQEVAGRPGTTTGSITPEKLAELLDLDCYSRSE